MKISGIYSGIGSILIPAKQMGWNITNCFEDRKEFQKFNPLEDYFNTRMYKNFDSFINNTDKIDIIISQPKCGMFSTYPSTRIKTCTKHPHMNNLIFAINKFQPEFFAIENLPKLFSVISIQELYEDLDFQYDIFPEYVTNCGYDNVQLRRRLWIIGAKKKLHYIFKANEHEPIITVKDTIQDLLSEESYHQFTNHHKINPNGQVKFMINVVSIDGKQFTPDKYFTWAQLKKYKFDRDKGERRTFLYTNRMGETWVKGFIKPTHWNRYSTTLAGSDCVPLHPKRFDPLTIRERLRFQGMPDDYKFDGIKLNEKNEMDPRTNIRYYWMTSRCIPTQFVEYLFKEFIGETLPIYSSVRLYKDYLVNLMKYLGCKKNLLTRSKSNCIFCAIKNTCSRSMLK